MEQSRRRRLRRYESDGVPFATEPGDPPLDFHSPFGPLIARLRIPEARLASLNQWADARVSAEQGSEFLVPRDVLDEGGETSLAAETARLVSRYLKRAEGDTPKRVEFEHFWVVSQYARTPSPVHFHTGDVSGVLYLKVPELDHPEAEAERTYISGRQAGWINFIIGGKQRLSRSLASFEPVPGDFYVFPGWLLHGAEPFRGSGERRSLAFNAFVPAPEA